MDVWRRDMTAVSLSKLPNVYNKMKEPNLSLMAYDLLDAATALAGILDQSVEKNCIKVNFAYAAELIRDVQLMAKSAADELMLIHAEKGGAR